MRGDDEWNLEGVGLGLKFAGRFAVLGMESLMG